MISVLIPVYNYDAGPLIASLYSQLLSCGCDFEIIACDDVSDNQMLLADDVVGLYPKLKYLQNPVNLGRTLTRRKLAETAVFNNLLFLDADVLPVTPNFIKLYLPHLNNPVTVCIGGIAYRQEPVIGSDLRLAYGIKREQKSAAERNKTPYGNVLSGNFLIDKETFFRHNFPQEKNLYGMDLYFAYSLWKAGVNVVHIDNPVYHLGLEPDDVFFRKSLEAVKNRKLLLNDYPEIAMTNGLAKRYMKLKKSGMDRLIALGFKLTEPLLRKMILRKKPNLFAFDIYRLGYICTLK